MKKSATKHDIVLCAAITVCLDGMGGTRPSDLYDDMFTWADPDDIVCPAVNATAARGYFGSWERKGWWQPDVDGDGNGAFTDEGVAAADDVWDDVQRWAASVS